jgi:hypothetical protein
MKNSPLCRLWKLSRVGPLARLILLSTVVAVGIISTLKASATECEKDVRQAAVDELYRLAHRTWRADPPVLTGTGAMGIRHYSVTLLAPSANHKMICGVYVLPLPEGQCEIQDVDC